MHNSVKYILLLFLASLSLVSCKQKQGNKIKVGFSQAMTTDDWRKQMNSSIKIEASLRPEVELKISDANNNIAKQIEDIETFISNKVDVIIVSPIQSKPLTAVVEKSIKAGIPVLVVDRKIEGENYTAYLGADNIEIGRITARYIISNSKGSGKIIEITGANGSSPAYERSLGFDQIINENKHFKVENTIHGDWEGESVKVPLKAILSKNSDIEYIFAHNDRMALSAWETAKTLGLEKKIKFIGVDGLNTVNGGIELVKSGILDGTILYPTGGNEALKLALKMYNKEPISKNNILNTIVIDQNNAEIIENQMDKVDQQQVVIESQQGAIKVQEREYASQNNLVRLLSFFLVIILSLTIYSIYSTISISRKKKQLERINQTVIDQNNEIQEMAQIAQRSNEAKLNFFTGLSHEFKTPITLIMSYVESLIENEKIKGTTLIDEVKLIHKNSNRLLRLINQLLDFRKIEEQKFTLRASNTKIYDFTNEVMTNFKGEAARRNIDFQLICKNKNLELFIDRGLMDKVYFNLLSNAFKFTPDNGKISILISENQDNTVRISFKDSGIGIPENELSNVFNPFFKASNNNKNSSGIGLHLSKEFVLLHQGTIELKSKQGTEFIITVLKGNIHLQPSEIVNKAENLNRTPNLILDNLDIGTDLNPDIVISESEKHTLLVIEDNIDLVTFLRAKLSSEYVVYTSDGSDAIEKTMEIIPDIIICDINLVDKDGYEISKELKKDLRSSHIPIIILTAQSDKESTLKGLQSGVDQYLTKPFSLSILKQSISSLLFNREKLRYYYTNNIYRVEPESKFGNQEQSFITKMNDIINRNVENPKFSVEDLADKLGVSRVQLYRKVKAIIGINISDHINNVKLEKAAELLKSNNMNISEIAYSLGFSSPNYFSTAFKNKFGISPKEYKSST
ncbi:substrate-binding domain-containing protein [Flavobacterium sp. Fl-77]|uniref:histidine kinase n=1 Tax=Flavobacterium flavipigmentatum TaxID=2893884 RepID=A0AAJ2VY88_9FLAO|nr:MULTISPECIES: substrate-binding domain-containing protein [unclassified Flavobacterium]MDX6182792.1 substrate-binding domain-containing protein [Flavobacterium sp. Fl-33]MDX6186029.1 substrate-binding domain-containing protein [Flavobacterium sp. Fl-77]UFH38182.1 substrate-binding domain-containing protein [Flavobacterium sp. F-70]